MTKNKDEPNKILGKYPPWHSLLHSCLESRAWWSCTAVLYAALGGLKDALNRSREVLWLIQLAKLLCPKSGR